MTFPATPGQTVGPFFAFGLPYDGGEDLVRPDAPGALRLHGYVYDGAGAPVPDALVEVWQSGPDGELVSAAGSLRRDGWTFTGWGRAATDATGHWQVTTVLPGAAERQAPFWAMTVFSRGLLDRLFTRAYVAGNPALAGDPLLASLDDARRGTLITRPDEHGHRFDIRLQGEDETVFLAYR